MNNYIHIILRDKSQTKNEYEPVDRTRKAINWLLAAFTVGGYEDLRISEVCHAVDHYNI